MNHSGTMYIYECSKNSIFKKVTVVISDNTPKDDLLEEDKKTNEINKEIKELMDMPKSLGYSGLVGDED